MYAKLLANFFTKLDRHPFYDDSSNKVFSVVQLYKKGHQAFM